MADQTTSTVAQSQAFTQCPECRTNIEYYDKTKSKYFACPNCGAYFEKVGGYNSVQRKFDDPHRTHSAFPLGHQCTIDNVDYTLVGYVQKKQADEEIYWREYAFYAPGADWYLILAEYNGHWLFITYIENQDIEEHTFASDSSYTGKYSTARLENTYYSLHLDYEFVIINAEGEFDWDILSDERLRTLEYVNAPNLLIKEIRGNIETWFSGSYLSTARLIAIFGVAPETLAARTEGYKFEPGKFYPRWQQTIVFTFVLLGLFALLNLGMTVIKPSKSVISDSFACMADSTTNPDIINCKPLMSHSFEITGPSAVEITLSAGNVDNNWMEIVADLVNDQTGYTYEVNKTISYYHGYDDGESWSEGSRTEKVMISSVPSGSYHLNIYPYLPTNGYATPTPDGQQQIRQNYPLDSFTIDVTQNAFLGREFWFMLIAIVLYPTIQIFRKANFENSNWFDSEYGSYGNN